MLDHRAVDAFIARQRALLEGAFDRNWAKGRAFYGERGRLPSPDPARKAEAMAPSFRSLERMRMELKGLSATAEQMRQAQAVAVAAEIPAGAVGAIAERIALEEWAASNGRRLDGGMSVIWAGEQLGFAEAAERAGERLRWQTEADGEVCTDCQGFGQEPAKPLPLWSTSPGAGKTLCNVGCRCSFEIEIDDEALRRPQNWRAQVSSGRDTFEVHTEEVGARRVFTSERAELHRGIIDEAIDAAAPSDRTRAWISAGGPAAGKSRVLERLRLPGHVLSNPDEVKLLLPEYDRMLEVGNVNRAAAHAHEESSIVAKAISSRALAERRPLVIDQVGGGTAPAFRAKLQPLRQVDDAVAIYVDVPVPEALVRSAARARETGRVVPEDYLRRGHRESAANWRDVAIRQPWLALQLWDTSSGVPVLIARKAAGSRRLEVLDRRLYRRYLAKAERRVGRGSDRRAREAYRLDVDAPELAEYLRRLAGRTGYGRSEADRDVAMTPDGRLSVGGPLEVGPQPDEEDPEVVYIDPDSE